MSHAPPQGEGLYDAQGRWVPRHLIKDIDAARHELVQELIDRARETSHALAEFKAQAMKDVAAFVALSAQDYNVHIGGKKGNVTLTSYDGRYRVVRAMANRLVFDERLQAAKELVDLCITEWAANSTDEIRTLVSHAFQVDEQGKINTSRVLGLRRLQIDHERWREAMRAISDSVQIASTTSYIRFYERGGDGRYKPISLDLATIELEIEEATSAATRSELGRALANAGRRPDLPDVPPGVEEPS